MEVSLSVLWVLWTGNSVGHLQFQHHWDEVSHVGDHSKSSFLPPFFLLPSSFLGMPFITTISLSFITSLFISLHMLVFPVFFVHYASFHSSSFLLSFRTSSFFLFSSSFSLIPFMVDSFHFSFHLFALWLLLFLNVFSFILFTSSSFVSSVSSRAPLEVNGITRLINS